MGDIAFVRKQVGAISNAYFAGWRPHLHKSMRDACPEVAVLIKEMWDADFRARPAMKDVVVRLEACVSVEGASNSDDDAPNPNGFAEAEHTNPLEATVRELRLEIQELKHQVETLEMQSGGKTVTGLHIRDRLGLHGPEAKAAMRS